MVNTDRLCLGCMNDNGGESVCPICGYDSSMDNSEKYLATGTWLNANRYYIGRVIEETADGATYIAWDNDEKAVVHIKEYFPDGIAVRSADRLTVTPATDMGLSFNKGREEFVRLFGRLAEANESVSILRVSDLFESGGTIYAVQKAVSGTTLQAFLLRNGGALKWEQVKPLFMPFISTISQLNEMGIYHRGICPDNIIVGRDGKLRLTGFCIPSVRNTLGEFVPQLPSGYAAPEQYLESNDNTYLCDIYSLGAVLFRTLIGTTPPDAKDRLLNDKLSIPTKITDTVPRGALIAIANALKVEPSERVGTCERLYKMLEAVSVGAVVIAKEPQEEPKKPRISAAVYASIAVVVTAIIFIVLLIFVGPKIGFNLFSKKEDEGQKTSAPPASSIQSSSKPTGYGPDTMLFVVPDIVGTPYFEFCEKIEPENPHFTFVEMGRKFSDTVPIGEICYQSVEAGAEVERDTVIEYYISAGANVDSATMPNIIKKSLDMGELELYRSGFLRSSLKFVPGVDDAARAVEPGQIYRVVYAKDSEKVIKSGNKVSITEPIIIYYRDPSFVDEEVSDTENPDNSGTGEPTPPTGENTQ